MDVEAVNVWMWVLVLLLGMFGAFLTMYVSYKTVFPTKMEPPENYHAQLHRALNDLPAKAYWETLADDPAVDIREVIAARLVAEGLEN